jgi:hypothetical protein
MNRPPSREEISQPQFTALVREKMNEGITAHGHQPARGYTPMAHRHYVRERALVGAMRTLSFSTALDVGCAEGYFTNALREQLGADVWGLDLSDEAARAGRERWGGEFAAGDALALPVADGSFDLVYSTETIEHVLDPGQMAREMLRVARRWVVVTTPISQSEHEHEPDYELHDEGHINDFDATAVKRLFGDDVAMGSFRCNASFAAVTAIGRKLRPRPRNAFYAFDHWLSQHAGTPTRAFKPLRNRDWLLVAKGHGAGDGVPRWSCPRCHGALEKRADGLFCATDDVRYPFLAGDAVPDFFAAEAA